ncbi:DUF4347 domain-containing protein [Rosistilla oblonga]|uniref:DUF4347 domain-containing protein n=1 Tax=Rosistilla oblonga TaxID=2527990 RepID=UPI003A97BF5A
MRNFRSKRTVAHNTGRRFSFEALEQRRLLAGDLSAQLAPEVAHRPAIAALVSPDPGMESSDAKEVTTFYRETQDLTGGISDASLFQAIDPFFAASSSANAPQFSADASIDRSGVEVLFIDARAGDIESLAAGAREDVEVVIVDGDRDGLRQIADYLVGRVDLAAVHIVSHGSSGTLLLGNSMVTSENLADFTDELAVIGDALSGDGDLFFYGCNVAAGERGTAFLSEVAALTGADIAASTDLTGVASLGGDWDLEAAVGTIDVELAFTDAVALEFQGLLNASVNVSADALTLDNFTNSNGTAGDEEISVNSSGTFYDFRLSEGIWSTGNAAALGFAGITGIGTDTLIISKAAFGATRRVEINDTASVDMDVYLASGVNLEHTLNLGDVGKIVGGGAVTVDAFTWSTDAVSASTGIDIPGVFTSGGAGQITMNQGAAISFGDAIDIDGGNLTLDAGDVTFGDTVDGGSTLTVNSTGTTTFNGFIGTVTPLGGLITNAGGVTNLNTEQGSINRIDGNVSFGDAVTLDTNIQLSVNGTLTFDSTLDSTGVGNGLILFGDSDGAVVFNGRVGASAANTELGSLQTSNVGTLTFNTDTVETRNQTTFDAPVVVNPTGNGTITFNSTFGTGGSIVFAQGIDSVTAAEDSVVVVANNATLYGDIGAAGNELNDLSVTAGTITLNGDIRTAANADGAGDVQFVGNVVLNGTTASIRTTTDVGGNTADGAFTVTGTIRGAAADTQSLSIDTGLSPLDLSGNEVGGGGNTLADLDLTSAGLTTGTIHLGTAPTAVWTTDSLVVSGTVATEGGTLTLVPRTSGTSIGIGVGAGSLGLSNNEVDRIDNGFTLITIGDAATGTGAVDIDTVVFQDDVAVFGGSINVDAMEAPNAITLNARTGAITSTAGGTDVTSTNVTLIAAAGITSLTTQGTAVTFTNTTGGDVTITDNNDATFSGTNTGGGGIHLGTATGALTVGTGNVLSNGGSVSLRADEMAINGSVNAGNGPVVLRAQTEASRRIDIGTETVGELSITATELDRITTTGGLTIGSATQNTTLQISDDIAPANITGGITLQTGSGTIDIDATVTANSDGATISSASGTIDFDDNGQVVAIGETVSLRTAGAIVDGNDTHIDVQANTATFQAGSGIGAINAIDTKVSNLTFNNTSAATQTNISNTGALYIAGASSFGGGGTLSTGSPMAINASITSAGDFTLEAAGSAADTDDLTVNNNITHTGTVGSAKTIILRADDDVRFDAGTVSFQNSHAGDVLNVNADSPLVASADANLTGDVDFSGGRVDVGLGTANFSTNTAAGGGAIVDTAGVGSDVVATTVHLTAHNGIGAANAIDVDANSIAFTNTASDVQISGASAATFAGVNAGTGATTLVTTTGDLSVGTSDIVTNGGTVTLNALASGASVIILDDATDGATISTIGGGASGAAITIVADDLDVQTALADGGAINSGAGLITIQPTTANRPISVGTNNASRLGITDSELDRITSSGGLTIGSGAQTGNITMSGAISPANLTGGTFLVQTGGAAGIAFAGAGIVTSDVAITFATNTGNIEFAGGSVTTSDDTITFEGNVRLSTGNSPISTGAGPGNVLFNGTVNSVDSSFPGVYRKLTVNAGTGTVQFAGLIGNASDGQLTDLDVTASLTTFIAGTVRIDAENRLTDTVTITGDVRLDGNVVFDLDKNSVRDSSLTITGTINADDATNRDRTLTVNAGEGTVSFGSTIGADQQLADLDVTASTIYLGGNVTVNDGTAQTISLTGNVVLTGDVAFDLEGTNDHHLHVSGTTVSQASQANDLQINTGATGDASFAGTVGSGTDLELGKITVNKTRTVTFDSAVEAASFVQAADSGTTQLAATGNLIDSTTVDGGTLQVTGSLDSTTTLNEGILDVDGQFVGSIVVNGGTLKGTGGTVTGAVTVKSGGTIAPGNSPGIIRVGDLTFTDGATFAVEIDDDNADDPAVAASKGAVAGTDYDQVQVVGAVSIGANVTLDLQDIGSSESNIGDVYTIIVNDAEDAISGSFAGLRDNAVIATGVGVYHQISYAGGDGNDVTLTRVEVGTIGDLVWNDLDGDGIRDAGEPGLTGVTVYIDSNSNGTRDGGEPSEVTDANGAYSFIELVASTYNIHVEPSSLPAGSVLSKGDSGYNVSLGAGEDFEDADFGVVPRRNVSLEVSASVGSEADGTIITVTARADGAVAGNQTVDLSVSGPGGESSDFTLSGTQIQIPHGQTSGSVTFTILDDDFAEATEQATLTISNPSIGVKIVTAAQEIEIQDNDEAGIAVSPTAGLITTETGATDTFTVRLTSQPRQSVTVNVTSGDATEGFVAADGSTFAASTSITIDPSQWNIPQTITVKGQDDGSPDGTVGYTIQSQATSSDPDYQGLSGTDVAVSNQDDEPALEFQQVLDERVWLTVNRITPDGIIIFAWGTEAGTTHLPQYGVTLGIADATLVSLAEGGTDGTASGYIPIPFTTAGQRYLFQAFEMAPNPQVTGVLPLNIAGAPVVVTDNNSAPELTEDLPSFTATVDKPFDFKIADDSFVDPDSDGELFYTARQTDGSALPQWLDFNPADLSFHSDAIPESGQWSITVTATDNGTPVRFSSTTFVLDALADQSIWQNQIDSRDVNGDGQTTPFDALIVLNRLNTSNDQSLATQRTDSDYLIDVNGDQSLTPIDALRVINWMNRSTQGVSGPVPHAITDPKDEDSSNIQPATLTVPVRVPKVGSTDQTSVASVGTSMPTDPIDYEENPNDDQRQDSSDYEAIVDQIFADGF